MKLTVLYGHPEDPAAFEDHYANEHRSLVEKIPGLQRFEVARVVATPDGSEPPYYMVAELYFESPEVLQESLASPEGQATAGDIPNFATGGATVLIAAVES